MIIVTLISATIFTRGLYSVYKRNTLRAPDIIIGDWVLQDLGP